MRPALTNAMLAIGASIVLLWAAIAFVLQEARSPAIEWASAAGEHTARVLAEYEASSLRAIDLTLRYLREDWLRDPRSLDAAVARHQEDLRREGLIQVAVVDADGWIRYSRLPLEKPLNFADRAYFQAQKASGRDEMHISGPVMGRITKQWAIQFTRPIRDRAGAFAGIIVVALPPPALELVYRDVRASSDDVVTLVRSDGVVLARTRDLDPVASASRLVAQSKVGSYPLTVYVSQGMDSVLAGYYWLRRVLVAAGILSSALLLILGRLWQSRRRLHGQVLEQERRAAESRERMMLELHDGAIQSIYAVGMNLERSREQ